MGRYMSAVTFCHFNIECNRALRSMIFYDELVILESDLRHSLSLYFFRYMNLIRHHTIKVNFFYRTCFGRGVNSNMLAYSIM